MPQAYVLISAETGSEEKVLKHLKTLSVVQEGYISYGVYDLIIKIKADTIEALKEAVTHHIRKTHHVMSTLTLILTEG